jgi:hypothetical protein
VNRKDIGAFELQFTPVESLIVTTITDEDNGTSDARVGSGTSFREAITFANSNNNAGTTDAITFSAFFNTARTIGLSSGLPFLTQAVSITGPGARLLTIARAAGATDSFSLLRLNSGVTLEISGLTLSGGTSSGAGGAIRNFGTLRATEVRFANNTSPFGGAIQNEANAMATVTRCLFVGNTASGGGAGINSDSTLIVKDSTFSGNTAQDTFGGGAVRSGGTAAAGGVTLESCTITLNRALANGGAVMSDNGGSITLLNTIVAGNLDLSGAAAGTDVDSRGSGIVTSSGYNLIGDGTRAGAFTAANNDLVIGDASPGLDALADNGGQTDTHALLPGSRAVDAGNPAVTTGVDQRSDPRVQRGRLDIGAFEVQNERPRFSNFTKDADRGQHHELHAVRLLRGLLRPRSERHPGAPADRLAARGQRGRAPAERRQRLGGPDHRRRRHRQAVVRAGRPTSAATPPSTSWARTPSASAWGQTAATVTLQVLAVNDAPTLSGHRKRHASLRGERRGHAHQREHRGRRCGLATTGGRHGCHHEQLRSG